MDVTDLLTAHHGGMRNFRKSSGWYQIRNARSGPAQVSIYDEIGTYGISAADFIGELGQIKGDIELHLNSGGGLVFEGLAIYNALRQRPGQVTVVVDGLAASIASVVAMAASPGQLAVAPQAALMIHEGYTAVMGNQEDLAREAASLGKASDAISQIYAERTGRPAAGWRDAMKAESWYYGQEAVDARLADRLLSQPDPGSPSGQADVGWLIDAFKEA